MSMPHYTHEHRIVELEDELQASQERYEAMREALVRYGRHFGFCAAADNNAPGVCECGFDAATRSGEVAAEQPDE